MSDQNSAQPAAGAASPGGGTDITDIGRAYREFPALDGDTEDIVSHSDAEGTPTSPSGSAWGKPWRHSGNIKDDIAGITFPTLEEFEKDFSSTFNTMQTGRQARHGAAEGPTMVYYTPQNELASPMAPRPADNPGQAWLDSLNPAPDTAHASSVQAFSSREADQRITSTDSSHPQNGRIDSPVHRPRGLRQQRQSTETGSKITASTDAAASNPLSRCSSAASVLHTLYSTWESCGSLVARHPGVTSLALIGATGAYVLTKRHWAEK